MSFVIFGYFFDTPFTYFPKYFLSKFCEILTSGKLFTVFSLNFLTDYLNACATFNWVLWAAKKNLSSNHWALCMVTFPYIRF